MCNYHKTWNVRKDRSRWKALFIVIVYYYTLCIHVCCKLVKFRDKLFLNSSITLYPVLNSSTNSNIKSTLEDVNKFKWFEVSISSENIFFLSHTHSTHTYKTLSSFVHRRIWVWVPKNENDLFNWIFHFFIFTGKRIFFFNSRVFHVLILI